MSKDFSFDIVSDFDHQEMVNAVDQAKREIISRYDFKGSMSAIDFEAKEALLIHTEDDYRLKSIIDILESKMIKRGLSLKILDLTSPVDYATGGTVRKKIPFKKGLKSEDAKLISKLIRENYPKVRPSIQGEEIRVVSAKKDELQSVINFLKEQNFNFPLQFENYR
ncbi:YajQ family cyclic di-GMP-binding protein [bacterium CG2_30_37_16]|nr:MAG: YajQ family cyclic di-GMP-binding protein [bacterium CG2_30_37_16]PIP30473.1 MAG: YajQ family cyclic di-GMP-binding protein [bacterium (Candidatus Howlettbacteria) CG23_combo_of_CG06-09_8_20_14_all_37_9]PIY00282.1 MAG: YajQ family cyclic di-GMP-binding protein [bacterium (Candidatus Howlettbacteria) CG_4_10_14_3_um_filter_37_10]PJB05647.1 MAG: YajQ family cyclic di-GMP-binding protein [bacterium (Candidatus Howlettbacteria) CG_4_9_14_3_um_filter_37_10]